jgi:hypothetical protein
LQICPFEHWESELQPVQKPPASTLQSWPVTQSAGVLQVEQMPCALQTRLKQSPRPLQCWPTWQGGQAAPPQSMSVSSPSLMPSVQEGKLQNTLRHTWPVGQTTLKQSGSAQPPSKHT